MFEFQSISVCGYPGQERIIMGLIINERRKTSGFSDTMTAVQTALGAVADLALCMGSSSFFL